MKKKLETRVFCPKIPSMTAPSVNTDHEKLLNWYRQNKRELPWRQSRDPYRIWVSEVMLQQTTVAAVIPFYEKFMRVFPTVQDLAKAPEGEVLQQWAGLGYYSRARNLHRAAKILADQGFPKTAAELIALPGFGPYTSAAVASIAFEDPAGVLDGNVIRVLSRRYGWEIAWWATAGRKQLQAQADAFAKAGEPSQINQALMELGATVCTPHSPSCLLCPWSSRCQARSENKIPQLPLAKPRKASEIWIWSPVVKIRSGKVALVENLEGPFLKGQWLFPGKFRLVQKKPKSFELRHGITHHDIFIQVQKQGVLPRKGVQWFELKKLDSVTPSQILKKTLATLGSKN